MMMMMYLCSFRYIVNHKRIYVTIVVLVSASECVGVPVPAQLSQRGHKWLSPHLYIEHCVENKVLFNCYSQVCT